MNNSYKPENYNSVSPYLIANDAEATINFLKHVFGAVELRRFPNETGKVMHAEVRIDDTVLMLADSIEEWTPTPSHVHVYVNDVDEIYRRALNAGATSVQEPKQQQGDEDKRGGVKDTNGVTWWVATKVS